VNAENAVVSVSCSVILLPSYQPGISGERSSRKLVEHNGLQSYPGSIIQDIHAISNNPARERIRFYEESDTVIDDWRRLLPAELAIEQAEQKYQRGFDVCSQRECARQHVLSEKRGWLVSVQISSALRTDLADQWHSRSSVMRRSHRVILGIGICFALSFGPGLCRFAGLNHSVDSFRSFMSEFKDQVKHLLTSTRYGAYCGVLSLLQDVAEMFALIGFRRRGTQKKTHTATCNSCAIIFNHPIFVWRSIAVSIQDLSLSLWVDMSWLPPIDRRSGRTVDYCSSCKISESTDVIWQHWTNRTSSSRRATGFERFGQFKRDQIKGSPHSFARSLTWKKWKLRRHFSVALKNGQF
jgi:hypothetical protein